MPNLVLFDFDNTITSNDNFTPFVHVAIDPATLFLGKIVLSPLFLGYKVGLFSASAMRASVVRFGFRGRNESEVRQLGSKYSREMLPQVIRPIAVERIKWHQAQGDTIAVVSASLDVYLTDWCNQIGADLICTELEVRNGILTGKYRGGDCSGEEKAKRVRERYELQKYNLIYAYGDSQEDEAMLRLAHKRFFRWKEVTETTSFLSQS